MDDQYARAARIASGQSPKIEVVTSFPARISDHLVYFEDISHPEQPADFVEGLLIAGGMSVIYGQSNSGKTFFASDLALHVACGWSWNGRDITQGAVLYCSLEGSHGIKNRVAAFKQHHGLDSLPFAVLPVTLDLLNPDGHVDEVLEAITKVKERTGKDVCLTVMDTLSRAMAGGNENAPDDMGALVSNGTRIQQQSKTHLSWIHHSGKDDARGARGHSLLRAATDTEIEITSAGPLRTARVTKQRDLDCIGEFNFTLKVVELGTNARGKPITSCVVDYGDSTALARGLEAGASSVRRHLGSHAKRALEVLMDLVAASGKSGFAGTPSGVQSVPDKWWRDNFYERAMPGEKDDTKLKAFKRAADTLINDHLVGMANRRVWLVPKWDVSSPPPEGRQDG